MNALPTLDKSISHAKNREIKILQYGEGNFLRGFVEDMFDIANEKEFFNGNIVIVKPIPHGNLDLFHQQECQYTLSLRGMENGKAVQNNRIITSVADAVSPYEEYQKYADYAKLDSLRFIVSNTTEAGIVYDETDDFNLLPPNTYPGKLTKFLYERFLHFGGRNDKGLIIIPCELIDNNGIILKETVLKLISLWNLGEDFLSWVENSCTFTLTLVDRIVTGYPKNEAESMWEQLGYRDDLLDTGERFALWVIEGAEKVKHEFPLDKAGLPVIFTDNHKPYKERKVRILNGAHTSFVLASFLAGNNTVLESMQDPEICCFLEKTIFEEIVPTLSLPEDELKSFAQSVLERFENPFIRHELLSIALNSVSKWSVRCMPSLIEYYKRTGKIAPRLSFSLAALLAFYASGRKTEKGYIGKRGETEYLIQDDEKVISFFIEHAEQDEKTLVESFIRTKAFGMAALAEINGMLDSVTRHLVKIRNTDVRSALKSL